MIFKGKGKILITIPEHYFVKNWDLSKYVKIPQKTINITSFLECPLRKRG